MVYQDKPCAVAETSLTVVKSGPINNEHDPVSASVMLLGAREGISRMYEFCRVRFPSKQATLDDARNAWINRHSDLTAEAQKIVVAQIRSSPTKRYDRFAPARLSAPQEDIEATAKGLVSKVTRLNSVEQDRWCENFGIYLESGEMNLIKHDTLVNTVSSASVKK